MTKSYLFNKLKVKNIFWSYDTSSILPDDVIIEQTLIYADVDDIKKLFKTYSIEKIKSVWDKKMAEDVRLQKLNYYLATIFFGIKNPNGYLKHKLQNNRYERIKKFIA